MYILYTLIGNQSHVKNNVFTLVPAKQTEVKPVDERRKSKKTFNNCTFWSMNSKSIVER